MKKEIKETIRVVLISLIILSLIPPLLKGIIEIKTKNFIGGLIDIGVQILIGWVFISLINIFMKRKERYECTVCGEKFENEKEAKNHQLNCKKKLTTFSIFSPF